MKEFYSSLESPIIAEEREEKERREKGEQKRREWSIINDTGWAICEIARLKCEICGIKCLLFKYTLLYNNHNNSVSLSQFSLYVFVKWHYCYLVNFKEKRVQGDDTPSLVRENHKNQFSWFSYSLVL